jgi:four helix bundle protein
MQNPANLQVSSKALELAESIYRLTSEYPKNEIFGLTTQMRRAAVSIGSNIFEGCGREGDKALLAFLRISLGSATELQFQLLLSSRLRFGDEVKLRQAGARTVEVKKMLSRLIVAIDAQARRTRGAGRAMEGSE